MRRPALTVVSLAVLATGCQPATMELTDEQKAEIEEAVLEASAEYTEVYHAEDIDGYMSFASDWAESPWGCCETLDGLRSFVTDYWDRWEFENVDNGEMKATVLGPDAAVVTFTQTRVQIDTTGEGREMASDLAFLWVREAGQWKLLMGKQYNHPVGM